jgi:hypothetical protein
MSIFSMRTESWQWTGSYHFQTDGSPTNINTGWVRLIPALSNSTPVASGIFGLNPTDVLISKSGIPSAESTTHARIYVDLSGGHNTGLAIANTAGNSSDIRLMAFESNGITSVESSADPLQLSGNGHVAKFADQFISGLPAGFTGVLDISSSTPFAALTLRFLSNERNDFLMTAFPIADANQSAPSPIVFPQIADGGGYVTQFILLSSGASYWPSNTTLSFHSETGEPLAMGR